MPKYIVKNCPCFQWSKCNWQEAKHECCSKNTDCPIKQVVEVLKLYAGTSGCFFSPANAVKPVWELKFDTESALQALQTLGVERV